jgi:hypothetical protein
MMRSRLFRLIYLAAIAVVMLGWIWLMVDVAARFF